ncbi:MAG: MOSC domain-containing protein [Deltaproteobacteria bacterium]|nr:MAG: MOSC domain-containing protein [Deltaproteobacteria bacterium]
MANEGRIEAIHLSVGEGEPMVAASRVRVVAGIGLEGDRYAVGRGHFSKSPGTGRALTLVEGEVLDSLCEALGVSLQPGESRRNLTTRGVALNDLVGRRFRVGAVLCEGMRLCEPCRYLEGVTGKPLLEPLLHRGGLRADVIEGGQIHVGDEIHVWQT